MEKWLITGGAGFIGSNFIRHALAKHPDIYLVNLDLLTYAGSHENLRDLPDAQRHEFVQGDIADPALVERLFIEHRFDKVLHFAAESHVDRSIHGPQAFIQTNVVGTFTLLDTARRHWGENGHTRRFLHVSTDEVYGTLRPNDPRFSETTPYAPNSPYAASKASSDLIARSYFRTYGFPVVTTNCSNSYGPYQYPEKLIPLMIVNALTGKELPVYGDGQQIRDWLYVGDHCEAIDTVLQGGRPGEIYNIGGDCERPNLKVVETICQILDDIHPRADGASYSSQIRFVEDRPGHDRRYATNATKIRTELGWQPRRDFAEGIRETIRWYLDHRSWINAVMRENYDDWIEVNYGERKAVS